MINSKVLALVATLTFSTATLGAEKTASTEMIDINSATKEQLMTLKGVGERTADDIIDYRKNNGNFKTLEDFDKVKGIGPKVLERNKERIAIK